MRKKLSNNFSIDFDQTIEIDRETLVFETFKNHDKLQFAYIIGLSF